MLRPPALGKGLLTRCNGELRAQVGGDHVLRKIVTWAIVIFLVYYLFSDPNGAANAMHHLFNLLKEAGNSLAKFVNHL
jgi:hypothetical protein